jgi:hypothetical protein
MKVTAKKKSYEHQLERFKEAARMLGYDEDEAAFDAKLKRIDNAQAPEWPAKKRKKRT